MSSESRNIIGDDFSPDLIAQINKRQTKLGNPNPKSDDIIYNNSKTSWLRVSSGVEISGSANDVGLGDYSKFEAKDFVLFGGVTGTKGPSEVLGGMQPLATTTADIVNDQIKAQYGIGAHTKWGFSPPPSVTSMDIQALNRGSIRKAQLMITAHNPDQFRMIELLYLRLGFTILVEWGHSTYYDNDGNLQKMDFQTTPFNKFFDSAGEGYKGLKAIHSEIVNERKKYHYNYDAFAGFITNFTWSVGSLGEYNINLTVMSYGALIDSLTINKASDAEDASSTNAEDSASSKIEKYFFRWKELLNAKGEGVEGGNYRTYADGSTTPSSPSYNTKNTYSSINDFGFEFIKDAEIVKVPRESPTDSSIDGDVSNYYISLGAFLRFIEEKEIITDNNGEPIISIDHRYKKSYMLSHPFQQSVDPGVCILKSTIKIFEDREVQEAQREPTPQEQAIETVNTATFGIFSSPPEPPPSEEPNDFEVVQEVTSSDGEELITVSSDSQGNLKYDVAIKTEYVVNAEAVRHFRDGLVESFQGYQGDIMGIMVNFDHILSVFQIQNEDKDIHSLLTSILKNISSVTGNINNFSVTYNEDDMKLVVYDERTSPGIDNVSDPEGNFHIQGFQSENALGSFVTDFAVNTKVFPKLTNLVAISAHTGDMPLPDAGSSFQVLNKKIKDRIMNNSILANTTGNDVKSTKSKYNNEIEDLNIFFKNTYILQKFENTFKDRKSALNDILKFDIQSKVLSNKLVSPFFIPVTLSVTLDGLSGMTLFQKFGITPDYILPPDYPKNLNFIIQGVNHSIKDNKWVTTLETLSWPKGPENLSEPTSDFEGDSSSSQPGSESQPDSESDSSNETSEWELIPEGNSFFFTQSGGGELSIESVLDLLHPSVRPQWRNFLTSLTNSQRLKGYKMVITSGYRSPSSQAALTQSGNSLATSGISLHNLGAVLDINIFKSSPSSPALRLASPKEAWLGSGIITLATQSGILWGGNFVNYPYDPVHFYNRINRPSSVAKLQDSYGEDFSNLTKNQIYNIDLVT